MPVARTVNNAICFAGSAGELALECRQRIAPGLFGLARALLRIGHGSKCGSTLHGLFDGALRSQAVGARGA
jgi:hypothetical protein